MSMIDVKKKLLMAQKSGIDVSEVFNTSLWTGTGEARTITTGIDSDDGSLVWIKRRNSATGHLLFDTSRGPNTYWDSSSNAASVNVGGSLTNFLIDGYSLGAVGGVTANGGTFVGWQWRVAKKFFDVVSYTGDGVNGRPISHSLEVQPGLMIIKSISSAGLAPVYSIETGLQVAYLNNTSAFITGSAWAGSVPTDTVFTVSSANVVNQLGTTYIAYLFAHDPSPEGLIQCGSYVGNGSTTGPVVNLGWRPQYLMIKNATGTGDWQIIDASRGFTAANDAILLASTSGAETSANLVNPSSTGFQLASTASNVNTSGQTYFYMAIREAA